jgi:hypothetical protein
MAKRKDRRWMQRASASIKRRKTTGSFTRWCKAHGYGGVTSAAIAAGLRAGGKIAKKAAFAKAARKARHAQGGQIGGEEVASSTYVAPQPSPFDISEAEGYDYGNLPGDIGTILSVTPFRFRMPTEEEYDVGRGEYGWKGRSKMLAESAGIGLVESMIGKLGSKALGRIAKRAGKSASKMNPEDYITNIKPEEIDVNFKKLSEDLVNDPWVREHFRKNPYLTKKFRKQWGIDDDFGPMTRALKEYPQFGNKFKRRGDIDFVPEGWTDVRYNVGSYYPPKMRKMKLESGGVIEGDEFGLGGWIKDNLGGIFGGLKTLGGAALMATGFGAPLGVGLIGSGIGDIVGEVKGDMAANQQEDLYNQQLAEQDKIRTEMEARAEIDKKKYAATLDAGPSNNPFTPTFAFGGTLPLVPAEVEDDEVLRTPRGKLRKVSGKTHSQGGIDVMEEPGTLVYSDREIYKATGNTYAEEADIIRRRIAQLDKQLA